MSTPSVARNAAFNFIRYASVWEDADILCEALTPVAGGGRLLSIASAGDNALALLTLDPEEVVAVDLNPTQLACVELRIAAFRCLGDADVPRFLGADPTKDRPVMYRALREELSREARAFWDEHPEAIAGGILHAGKFERYLRTFRRRVLPLVHGRGTIAGLLKPRDDPERERFYERRWNTFRWRLLFRLFFSRAVMARGGRDPAFFAHVKGSVAQRILDRTRHALTALPTDTNPYLAYILTGTFPKPARPRYLQPRYIPLIRQRLDRLTLIEAPAQEAGRGPYRGFNLSDIFEYMTPDEHRTVYSSLLDQAEPGARLVYWNMLVPRERPAVEGARAHSLRDLARDLHQRDRAWFYQALHVDVVEGESAR
jgi:S-adenosylmethionine-diacylglycerol 3-amino-3-carboxypropyl transferase